MIRFSALPASCAASIVGPAADWCGTMLRSCGQEFRRDRWLGWTAAFLALLIFCGIQAGGGAYRAEFDGHPDEAAHFITGLMVRDYVLNWPPRQPVVWAQQYYVHYPKVAFGHWPPLFHLMEAAWWVFLPPARWSGVLLVGLLGWGCGVLFYRLARCVVHPAVAGLLAAVLAATPVFQQAVSQTMTEASSLFFGLLYLHALVEMLEHGPAYGRIARAVLWCALCLMVSGTGVCLLAAPALAFGIARAARTPSERVPEAVSGRPPFRSVALVWLPFAALLAVGAVFFSLQYGSLRQMTGWAGVRFSLPWTVYSLPRLAGWGILGLALGGLLTLRLSRSPSVIGAAAMALSIFATSFFLRAMTEPRHWILALPAILLLAASFLRLLSGIRVAWLRTVALTSAVLAGLLCFPWQYYRQAPGVHSTILSRLARPSRVLVSSGVGWYEGGWIATASLGEKRPASVIARATKVLATSGWSGNHYRLLASSPQEVEETLDRYAIDAVLVDDRPSGQSPPAHHRLLKQMLAASPAWRECAEAAPVSLWCRVLPPRVPRRPMRLRIHGRGRPEIEER